MVGKWNAHSYSTYIFQSNVNTKWYLHYEMHWCGFYSFCKMECKMLRTLAERIESFWKPLQICAVHYIYDRYGWYVRFTKSSNILVSIAFYIITSTWDKSLKAMAKLANDTTTSNIIRICYTTTSPFII